MPADPLALETRRRLFDVVRTTPGLSAREIQRGAGTGWGETVYHLERLEESGLLQRERGGHQDFYFAASVPLGERTLLRLARSAAVRRILVTVLDRPGRTLPEIAEGTAMSLSRASIHLRRLLDTGVVASGQRDRWRTFSVVEPERVARLLVLYRAGFQDDWIDRLSGAWADLFPA